MNKKRLLIIIILFVVIVVFLFLPQIRLASLSGKWCLYIGTDIKSDEAISENIDSETYVYIYKRFEAEKRYGVHGVGMIFTTPINILLDGDAVYKYKIRRINGEKVLIRTLLDKNEVDKNIYIYVSPTTAEEFKILKYSR